MDYREQVKRLELKYIEFEHTYDGSTVSSPDEERDGLFRRFTTRLLGVAADNSITELGHISYVVFHYRYAVCAGLSIIDEADAISQDMYEAHNEVARKLRPAKEPRTCGGRKWFMASEAVTSRACRHHQWNYKGAGFLATLNSRGAHPDRDASRCELWEQREEKKP